MTFYNYLLTKFIITFVDCLDKGNKKILKAQLDYKRVFLQGLPRDYIPKYSFSEFELVKKTMVWWYTIDNIHFNIPENEMQKNEKKTNNVILNNIFKLKNKTDGKSQIELIS